MNKDITIVWRRYEDIEVGDIVGPPTGADHDRATDWRVVEAVQQLPDHYLGNRTVELTVGGFKLTAGPLHLIQVQVENFS